MKALFLPRYEVEKLIRLKRRLARTTPYTAALCRDGGRYWVQAFGTSHDCNQAIAEHIWRVYSLE